MSSPICVNLVVHGYTRSIERTRNYSIPLVIKKLVEIYGAEIFNDELTQERRGSKPLWQGVYIEGKPLWPILKHFEWDLVFKGGRSLDHVVCTLNSRISFMLWWKLGTEYANNSVSLYTISTKVEFKVNDDYAKVFKTKDETVCYFGNSTTKRFVRWKTVTGEQFRLKMVLNRVTGKLTFRFNDVPQHEYITIQPSTDDIYQLKIRYDHPNYAPTNPLKVTFFKK